MNPLSDMGKSDDMWHKFNGKFVKEISKGQLLILNCFKT